MLKISGLRKTFMVEGRQQVALRGIDLVVPSGQFVTIVGSNGAGKSTLLNSLAGVFPPSEGTISLGGITLDKLAEHQRGRFIGRVFQDPLQGTCGDLTIGENLVMAELRGKSKGLGRGLTKRRIALFRESLCRLGLGLENRIDAKVRELSGGQRQALALILATITSPKLLLLDEHTAALDPKTGAAIMQLTQGIVQELGLTTLMVTHNIHYSLSAGVRTLMMHEGEIVLDIEDEERQKMTVEKLINKFTEIKRDAMLADRTLLTG